MPRILEYIKIRVKNLHPPLHRKRTARTNRAYGKTASAISTAVDYGRCETYGIAPPAISHTKADRICQRHDKTGKSRRFPEWCRYRISIDTSGENDPSIRKEDITGISQPSFPARRYRSAASPQTREKLHNRHMQLLHTLPPASHIRAYCWEAL